MKKLILTTLVIVSGLITNNNVQAENTNSGVYVSAIGGANLLNVPEVNVQNIKSVTFTGYDTYKFDFSTGYATGGAIGYRFCNIPLRVEGEFMYRNNQIKNFVANDQKLSFKDLDLDASINSYAYMGNLFYELNLGSDFTPYIGVGAGYVVTEFKAEIEKVDARVCNNTFGTQGIVGVSYAICDKTEAALEYRYLQTYNNANAQNHGITLNLRRFF